AIWFLYFAIVRLMIGWAKRLSPGRGTLLRTQTGLLGLAALLLFSAKWFLLFTDMSPFLIPVATVALWTAVHLDRYAAFPVGVSVALLLGCVGGFDPALFAVSLSGTLAAILLYRGRKQSSHMIFLGTAAGLTGAAVFTAYKAVS